MNMFLRQESCVQVIRYVRSYLIPEIIAEPPRVFRGHLLNACGIATFQITLIFCLPPSPFPILKGNHLPCGPIIPSIW